MSFNPFRKKDGKPKDLAEPYRKIKHSWHQNHIAYRDVLGFDDERKRFVLDRSTMVQSDVVPDDLLIDGEKWKWFQTTIELPKIPDTRVEVEGEDEVTYLNPTPITYNLYYESDAINNASTGEFRSKIINPMTLALIVGVGIVLMIFVLFR